LAVLSSLDDVPAGMPQNPRHVIIVAAVLSMDQRVGDARPHPPRQPFAFAPCQRRQKIVNPRLLCAKPSPQIMLERPQRRCGKLATQPIRALRRPRSDPSIEDCSPGARRPPLGPRRNPVAVVTMLG